MKHDLVRALLRRRYVAGAVFFGALLPMVFLIRSMPDEYTATTTVMVDPREETFVDVKSIVASALGDKAAIASEMEVMRSRDIIRKLVLRFLLQKLDEFKSGVGLQGSDQEAVSATIDKVSKHLSLATLNESRVIEIAFTCRDPRLAVQMADGVAQLYLSQQEDNQLKLTRKASSWLEANLIELRQKAESADKAVDQFREQNIASKGLNADWIDQQERTYSETLIAARNEASRLRGEYEGLVKANLRENVKPGAGASLQQGEGEVERFSSGSSSGEQARLQNVDSDLKTADNRVAELASGLKGLGEMREQALKSEAELHSLERDAEAARTVSETFVKRTKETEQIELALPHAWIVSSADLPTKPTKPLRLFLSLGAFLASALVSVTTIAGFEFFGDVNFISLDEIRAELGLPTYATVPSVSKRALSKSLARDLVALGLRDSGSAFGAALRGIVAGLVLQMEQDSIGNTVMFASALPGEGKTTLALCSACLLSEQGFRVLLIDGDLYRPRIHQMLSIDNSIGLSSYLSSTAKDECSCIIKDAHASGLSVVTSGPLSGDLLDVRGISSFVDAIKPLFDIIVVDTAPVLLRPDSRLLARTLGRSIFVVRWNGPARKAVGYALTLLKEAGLESAGVVLNRVDVSRQSNLDCTEASYLTEATYNSYVATIPPAVQQWKKPSRTPSIASLHGQSSL